MQQFKKGNGKMSSQNEEKKAREFMIGIPGFDELVGGFSSGSVIILVGNPGSGFETFAHQALYNRAQKGGEVACFTIERPPSEIEEDMQAFNWDVKKFVEKGNWHFIDIYSPRMQSRTTFEAEMEAIRILSTQMELRLVDGTWSVIETISPLLLIHDFKVVLNLFEQFIGNARKCGGLHFILLVQGMHDKKNLTTLFHFADGVIQFMMGGTTERTEGLLRIIKMRRKIGRPRLFTYNVTMHGITIETAVRIR
jgi:KaiC/GvpD/RAD55 family RecA-like ATPase